jgi:soluble lytic murein transglycosylase-like protein
MSEQAGSEFLLTFGVDPESFEGINAQLQTGLKGAVEKTLELTVLVDPAQIEAQLKGRPIPVPITPVFAGAGLTEIRTEIAALFGASGGFTKFSADVRGLTATAGSLKTTVGSLNALDFAPGVGRLTDAVTQVRSLLAEVAAMKLPALPAGGGLTGREADPIAARRRSIAMETAELGKGDELNRFANRAQEAIDGVRIAHQTLQGELRVTRTRRAGELGSVETSVTGQHIPSSERVTVSRQEQTRLEQFNAALASAKQRATRQEIETQRLAAQLEAVPASDVQAKLAAGKALADSIEKQRIALQQAEAVAAIAIEKDLGGFASKLAEIREKIEATTSKGWKTRLGKQAGPLEEVVQRRLAALEGVQERLTALAPMEERHVTGPGGYQANLAAENSRKEAAKAEEQNNARLRAENLNSQRANEAELKKQADEKQKAEQAALDTEDRNKKAQMQRAQQQDADRAREQQRLEDQENARRLRESQQSQRVNEAEVARLGKVSAAAEFVGGREGVTSFRGPTGTGSFAAGTIPTRFGRLPGDIRLGDRSGAGVVISADENKQAAKEIGTFESLERRLEAAQARLERTQGSRWLSARSKTSGIARSAQEQQQIMQEQIELLDGPIASQFEAAGVKLDNAIAAGMAAGLPAIEMQALRQGRVMVAAAEEERAAVLAIKRGEYDEQIKMAGRAATEAAIAAQQGAGGHGGAFGGGFARHASNFLQYAVLGTALYGAQQQVSEALKNATEVEGKIAELRMSSVQPFNKEDLTLVRNIASVFSVEFVRSQEDVVSALSAMYRTTDQNADSTDRLRTAARDLAPVLRFVQITGADVAKTMDDSRAASHGLGIGMNNMADVYGKILALSKGAAEGPQKASVAMLDMVGDFSSVGKAAGFSTDAILAFAKTTNDWETKTGKGMAAEWRSFVSNLMAARDQLAKEGIHIEWGKPQAAQQLMAALPRLGELAKQGDPRLPIPKNLQGAFMEFARPEFGQQFQREMEISRKASAATADQMQKIAKDTPIYKIEQAKYAWQALTVVLAQDFLPTLVRGAELFKNFIDQVQAGHGPVVSFGKALLGAFVMAMLLKAGLAINAVIAGVIKLGSLSTIWATMTTFLTANVVQGLILAGVIALIASHLANIGREMRQQQQDADLRKQETTFGTQTARFKATQAFQQDYFPGTGAGVGGQIGSAVTGMRLGVQGMVGGNAAYVREALAYLNAEGQRAGFPMGGHGMSNVELGSQGARGLQDALLARQALGALSEQLQIATNKDWRSSEAGKKLAPLYDKLQAYIAEIDKSYAEDAGRRKGLYGAQVLGAKRRADLKKAIEEAGAAVTAVPIDRGPSMLEDIGAGAVKIGKPAFDAFSKMVGGAADKAARETFDRYQKAIAELNQGSHAGYTQEPGAADTQGEPSFNDRLQEYQRRVAGFQAALQALKGDQEAYREQTDLTKISVSSLADEEQHLNAIYQGRDMPTEALKQRLSLLRQQLALHQTMLSQLREESKYIESARYKTNQLQVPVFAVSTGLSGRIPATNAVSSVPTTLLPETEWGGRLPATLIKQARRYGYDPNVIPQAAIRHGLNPELLISLIRQESGFNPNIQGPPTKYGRAVGLGQFLAGTAASMGLKDRTNAAASADAAARYLKQQIDKFGSVESGLAAYNAGPGNVARYHGIPPFAETQNYVRTIMRNIPAGMPGSTRLGPPVLLAGPPVGKMQGPIVSALTQNAPLIASHSGVVTDINAPMFDIGGGAKVSLAQARAAIMYVSSTFSATKAKGDRFGLGQISQGDFAKLGLGDWKSYQESPQTQIAAIDKLLLRSVLEQGGFGKGLAAKWSQSREIMGILRDMHATGTGVNYTARGGAVGTVSPWETSTIGLLNSSSGLTPGAMRTLSDKAMLNRQARQNPPGGPLRAPYGGPLLGEVLAGSKEESAAIKTEIEARVAQGHAAMELDRASLQNRADQLKETMQLEEQYMTIMEAELNVAVRPLALAMRDLTEEYRLQDIELAKHQRDLDSTLALYQALGNSPENIIRTAHVLTDEFERQSAGAAKMGARYEELNGQFETFHRLAFQIQQADINWEKPFDVSAEVEAKFQSRITAAQLSGKATSPFVSRQQLTREALQPHYEALTRQVLDATGFAGKSLEDFANAYRDFFEKAHQGTALDAALKRGALTPEDIALINKIAAEYQANAEKALQSRDAFVAAMRQSVQALSAQELLSLTQAFKEGMADIEVQSVKTRAQLDLMRASSDALGISFEKTPGYIAATGIELGDLQSKLLLNRSQMERLNRVLVDSLAIEQEMSNLVVPAGEKDPAKYRSDAYLKAWQSRGYLGPGPTPETLRGDIRGLDTQNTQYMQSINQLMLRPLTMRDDFRDYRTGVGTAQGSLARQLELAQLSPDRITKTEDALKSFTDALTQNAQSAVENFATELLNLGETQQRLNIMLASGTLTGEAQAKAQQMLADVQGRELVVTGEYNTALDSLRKMTEIQAKNEEVRFQRQAIESGVEDFFLNKGTTTGTTGGRRGGRNTIPEQRIEGLFQGIGNQLYERNVRRTIGGVMDKLFNKVGLKEQTPEEQLKVAITSSVSATTMNTKAIEEMTRALMGSSGPLSPDALSKKLQGMDLPTLGTFASSNVTPDMVTSGVLPKLGDAIGTAAGTGIVGELSQAIEHKGPGFLMGGALMSADVTTSDGSPGSAAGGPLSSPWMPQGTIGGPGQGPAFAAARPRGMGQVGNYLNMASSAFGAWQGGVQSGGGWEGALMGAGQGIMAGASFGPWGMAAGGLLGLLGSIFGQEKKQNDTVERIFNEMPKRTDVTFAATNYLPFSAYAGGRASRFDIQVNMSGFLVSDPRQAPGFASALADNLAPVLRRQVSQGPLVPRG